MAGKVDNYTISINGDDRNLQLAVRNSVGGLNKVGRAANDASGGTKALSGGLRQAATNAAAFEGPLGGVSGRLGAMSSLLGSVNPAMVGLGLAVSGVTIFMSSAIKEQDQFALRNKKQEALLRSTGFAAGFAAHELDAMAKSVALNTLASVEGIKDTQNVLLSFKGISEESFRSAITLSQDMAAVMGGDSKSAALQLGKALESPTDGISALKRAGVSFSQAEKDMIRDMEESGRVAEAQTFILATLTNQIGGAGAAEADGTLAGAVDTLSQRWQQLKVTVAEDSGAGTGMKRLANGMADIVDRVTHMISPDDNARMAQLWITTQNLTSEIERLEAAKGKMNWNPFSTNVDLLNTAKLELAAVNKEMAELEKDKAVRLAKEKEANDAATANQKKNADEQIALKAAKDAADLARIHTKHAAELSAMDMKFAGENEKINLNYQKNLTAIDGWQLSEQEIKARGFETMAELQESYRLLAAEKLDADLLKIQTKIDEAEEAKTQKAKEESEKRAKNEAEAQKSALAAFQSTSGMFLGALRKSAGDKSGIYKAAFAAQQAAAIPGMIVATEEGAAKALALGPIAGPIAAGTIKAMGYAGIGLVAGQTIAGAFENGGIVGGSSYTGDNLTAFVNSSEMILNRPQQKQLFDMANGVGGGSGSGVVVNMYEDASRAGQVEQDKSPSGEDIINVWVANINQGGAAASTMEERYGLERVGR